MVNSGLEGIVAASTRLSHVDGERGELIIAGYPVGELAEHATFEETTWLLWHGDLPSSAQLEAFRAELAAAARRCRRRPMALLRECAQARLDPMDALRIAAGTISLRLRRPLRGIVARMPTIVAAYLAAAAGPGADRTAPRSRPRRELPLHAERTDAGRGARARARDLSQHRRRPRAQRVDLHRARDHVNRIGPRLGCRRRARRAQGAAARRRAGPGARHGVRDRRRVARRGGSAEEDRSRREADGIRPPRLQGARPARGRPRHSRGADVHAGRRHVALHARAQRRERRRFGCSKSTSPDDGCRRTSSSTPRCFCTASGSRCRCSRRRLPSAGSAAGSRTRSSSAAPTASFVRSRNTSALGIAGGSRWLSAATLFPSEAGLQTPPRLGFPGK